VKGSLLPAKHSARSFGTARLLLSFGVAILVLLVVWIAVRAVGPADAARSPSVVLPSVPLLIPSATGSPTPSPSATPSRVTASPVPSKTRKPTTRPPRTTPPAPPPPAAKPKAEASVRLSSNRDQGYVAGVRVENTGTTPLEWRVTVTHDDDDDVRLRGTWNATGDQDGDRLTFRGGTLQPGTSVTFGYQTMNDGRRSARPTGCSVVGGTCSMS
jgi:hypothetical protein